MWEFLQIQPQNARGKLKEEMWDNPNWIAEEKFDGDRRVAQFCGDLVRFTGRKKSVFDGKFVEKTKNIPHLSGSPEYQKGDWRDPPQELEGTVLDGEIVTPADFVTGAGGKSKHVASIMGSLPPEAIRKQQERGFLRYAVFDCLWYKGHDLRHLALQARWEFLSKAMEEWHNKFAFTVPRMFVDKKKYLDEIEEAGGEGLILKFMGQKYGDQFGGHRYWVKVKFDFSADVIVTGYKDPKEISKKVDGTISATKYAGTGLIGAIRFGQYKGDGKIHECGYTSGIDELLRAQVSQNPDFYLGRVLTIKHFGREPTGKFRHPQFKDWREDKAPEQCLWDENET